MADKKIITGLLAAIGASLCCITPVLAVLAGSTGLASTFSWMEPFRPYLIALTVGVLAYAWWDKLKPKKEDIACACDPDEEGKVSFWYSKAFLVIVTVFAIVMLSFPYWGDTLIRKDSPTVVIDPKNLQERVIEIEGMTCKACEASIERVVMDKKGVVEIKASHKDKNAIVRYDRGKIDIQSIAQAIASTGYRPVSYRDAKGVHVLSTKHLKTEQSHNRVLKSSQCGGGKCGAGKCGAGKCGVGK